MKKLSPKRQLEILKSREEFDDRLRAKAWKSSQADVEFRLAALEAFHPGRSTRQIFNQAELNQGR